jgi:adenosylcobinamide-GDP ribazoletransferase
MPEPEPAHRAAAEEPTFARTPVPDEEPVEQRHGGSGLAGGPLNAIKGAISFFTIIKLNVGDKEIQAMNRNLYLIPIVGLIIGVIAAAIGLMFTEVGAASMAPVAVMGTAYVISKFLHLDGLADFGDGMISSKSKEGSINALKDSRVGAGGIGVALMVMIAIYAGLSGMLAAFAIATVIIVMEVFAKNAMVAAAAFGEPGTGMASEQVRCAGTQTMLVSTALSAGFAFAGYLAMGAIAHVLDYGTLETVYIIASVLLIAGAAASSIFIGWLIAFLANRKFGFVNGDVLGATNEISKILVLFIALVIVNFYIAPDITAIIPWPFLR